MADEEAPEVTTELIAQNADVALLVGTPPVVRLLVLSTVLTAASKVFAALLGPNFSEGQDIASATVANPKEIKLPDDESESMSDMCHLLHGKVVHKYLRGATADTILGLAITVDKYACVDALRMQSQGILLTPHNCNATVSIGEDGKRMLAAYLLDNSRAFYLITAHLVSRYTGSYHHLLEAHGSHQLPMAVLYYLEAKRSAAQRYLLATITSRCKPSPTASNDAYSTHAGRMSAAFGTSMWPPKFEDHPIAHFTASVEKVSTTDFCSYFSTEFVKSTLEDYSSGLCLKCVKESKPDQLRQCKSREHGAL